METEVLSLDDGSSIFSSLYATFLEGAKVQPLPMHWRISLNQGIFVLLPRLGDLKAAWKHAISFSHRVSCMRLGFHYIMLYSQKQELQLSLTFDKSLRRWCYFSFVLYYVDSLFSWFHDVRLV